MKITASFVTVRPRVALMLAAVLWVLSLLLGALGLCLALNTVEMRAAQPHLKERLTRLNEQLESAHQRHPLPPTTELEALRQRVSALNVLSGVQGWSTPQLFGWLEKHLPENVYLVSLHHKPRHAEALMVAESQSTEALTAFLLKLEKESGFSEVLLSKQGTRRAASGSAVQFELRVRQKL